MVHMANAGDRLDLIGEVPAPEPEGDVYKSDQHRHLHQGADYSCKGLPGIDAENRHVHCNRQFEIVGGGGKAQRRRLFVVRSHLHG